MEKYKINFVTFHNGLLGGVNCNAERLKDNLNTVPFLNLQQKNDMMKSQTGEELHMANIYDGAFRTI